ncbi:MAG: hypothetical protein NTX84_07825 [Nitrospirae bacterium]|nr:hypothetical protein [Nitrospirota bacterium]
MTPREVKAQQFTETARSLARERTKTLLEAHEATRQVCSRCKKERGIGYVEMDEHGDPICIFCHEKQAKALAASTDTPSTSA